MNHDKWSDLCVSTCFGCFVEEILREDVNVTLNTDTYTFSSFVTFIDDHSGTFRMGTKQYWLKGLKNPENQFTITFKEDVSNISNSLV